MPITACKGTVDILPAETTRWRQLEETAHRVAQLFGYKEIRTPAFEVTELFTEALSDATEVIERELYTFRDKSGRSLTLRPEMTVPTVRAYLEHNLGSQSPLRAYYLSEIWRYERPVPGRTRESHQFGVEAIGSPSAALDAEMVDLAMHFFKELGLKDLRVEVNSVGCKRCRPAYQALLKDFFLGKDDVLCQDCERSKDKNPIRILDCRKDSCLAVTNTTPTIFQTLCADCKTHFFSFKDHLTQMGLTVNGNPRVVVGLGYYTRTVFQVVSPALGPHNPLCSGGRFDDLIAQLGSSATPAVGFAIGLERTLLALEKAAVPPPVDPKIDVFLIGTGEEAERIMSRTLHQLRSRGWKAERDFSGKGIKNQMKIAEKAGATFQVVVGEEDTRVTQVQVHDMARGSQENVSVNRLVDALEFKLRREQRDRGRDTARGSRDGEERGRDRGRGRDRDRLGREERDRDRDYVRSDRGDRGERGERERDDEGARFNEWAATYSEAQRSSPPRPTRRVPLSEHAFENAPVALDGLHAAEVWAQSQQGLQQPATAETLPPWPPVPFTLTSGVPPRREPRPIRKQADSEPNGDGEQPRNRVHVSLDVEQEIAFSGDTAAYGERIVLTETDSGDHFEDDLDDDDGDGDGEGDEGGNGEGQMAGSGAGRNGENGDAKRRRGGRRGGRRHGRRKPRSK
jgi:histidyl-tRNA synthetase